MNPYAPKKDKKPEPKREEAVQEDNLTIVYVTARKDPKAEWFLDSLALQKNPDDNISVIIVDLHAKLRSGDELLGHGFNIQRVLPKPSVWCGDHRLTKTDWWAASSFRNTGLCLCPTDWIAYVDDVSVLCSNWLLAAKEATTREGIVTCGAYQKVKKLEVIEGQIIDYEEFDAGLDHRGASERRGVVACHGNWLYGCSLVAPVESILDVGGWPEFCDSASGEDTALGTMLNNNGTTLVYDPRLKTLESEEHHGHVVGDSNTWVGGVRETHEIKRADKGNIGTEDSKSWAVLRKAQGLRFFNNYYAGGMRELREQILSGVSFPIIGEPTTDWYDDQPLCEM